MNHKFRPDCRRDHAHRVTVSPQTDIVERAEGLFIYCNMPGVTEEALRISIEDTTLFIHGETAFGPMPQGRIHALEFDDVVFETRFPVPKTVDHSSIAASLRDGVLELFLPYPPKSVPRRIPVSAS